MKTKREIFIDYVKDGGDQVCSPQIGAGAGFDTKLAGKEWISETTLDDTITAVNSFNIIPLINIGCSYEERMASLWKCIQSERSGAKIVSKYLLETPVGCLTRQIVETKKEGSFVPKCPVTCKDDLDAMEYYIDMLLDGDFTGITDDVRTAVNKIEGRAALSVQWSVQPYELLCLANTVDTVLLHNDFPERCMAMMDRILEINKKLFKAVAVGGCDFIFLGAPGVEMLSPSIYERLIIPYSKMATDAAHDYGLLVYSHICSPVEPFLSMGFYNRMGIDLFETLSPPPVGNVASLKDALGKLDGRICTRGNIGLDILLNGSTDEVREKTFEVLSETAGRKHIVAASDYLFYGVPEENVHAMAETVNECAGKRSIYETT